MTLSHEETVRDLIDGIESELVEGFSHLLNESRECELCGADEWAVETVISKASVETHSIECRKCGDDFWTDKIAVSIENVALPTTQDKITKTDCPNCNYSNNGVRTAVESKDDLHSVESEYRFVRYVTKTKIAWHHTSYIEQDVMPVCYSCHSKIHNQRGFRDDLEPEISRTEAKARGLLYE